MISSNACRGACGSCGGVWSHWCNRALAILFSQARGGLQHGATNIKVGHALRTFLVSWTRGCMSLCCGLASRQGSSHSLRDIGMSYHCFCCPVPVQICTSGDCSGGVCRWKLHSCGCNQVFGLLTNMEARHSQLQELAVAMARPAGMLWHPCNTCHAEQHIW